VLQIKMERLAGHAKQFHERDGVFQRVDPIAPPREPDPPDQFAGGDNYRHDNRADGEQHIGIAKPLCAGLCAGITKYRNIKNVN
jgi:hypothetical protein